MGEGGASCGGGAWSGYGGGAANGCGMGRGPALTCRLAAKRVISCCSASEPPTRKGAQGFPRPPRPAAPPAVPCPPGAPEVREVLPTRPSGFSSS